jgi:CRP-like cAMP-binding protein
MQLKAGDYLFMEGSFDDHLYIVKKGFLTAERREHGMTQVQWVFEPGSLIGEGALLENRPHTHAVKASVDSELIVLEQSELKQSLAKSPNWFVSIVYFLSRRFRDAEKKHAQHNRIRALPSLLFILSQGFQNKNFDVKEVMKNLYFLTGLKSKEALYLLQILESLGLFKIFDGQIHHPNYHVIQMLYGALFFRATRKQIPATILSITDQLILNAFVQTTKEDGFLFKEQTAIESATFFKMGSKYAHGLRLSNKSLDDLLNKKILTHVTELDSDFIYGDIDSILDLLELNRIYPLLDKKLIDTP